TINETTLLSQQQPVKEKLIGNVTNSRVLQFWQSYNELKAQDQMGHISSMLKQVDAFLTQSNIANIVGQSTTTLDFRTIIDERKILLVKLDPSSEDISSLVGAVILGQLLNAAISRKDLSEFQRKQFNVHADEYA